MNQIVLLIIGLSLSTNLYSSGSARQTAGLFRSVPELIEIARTKANQAAQAAKIAADQQTAQAMKRPVGKVPTAQNPTSAKSVYDILRVKNPHKPFSVTTKAPQLPAIAQPAKPNTVMITETQLAALRAQQPKGSLQKTVQETQTGLSFLQALAKSQPKHAMGIGKQTQKATDYVFTSVRPGNLSITAGNSEVATQKASQVMRVPRPMKSMQTQQPGLVTQPPRIHVNATVVVEPTVKLPTQPLALPNKPTTIAVQPPAPLALPASAEAPVLALKAGQELVAVAEVVEVAQAPSVQTIMRAMQNMLEQPGAGPVLQMLIDPVRQRIGFVSGDIRAVLDRTTSRQLFATLQGFLPKQPIALQVTQPARNLPLTFTPLDLSANTLRTMEARLVQLEQLAVDEVATERAVERMLDRLETAPAEQLLALEAAPVAPTPTARPTYVRPTQPTAAQTQPARPIYQRPTRPTAPATTPRTPPTMPAPAANPTVAPAAVATASRMTKLADSLRTMRDTAAQTLRNFFARLTGRATPATARPATQRAALPSTQTRTTQQTIEQQVVRPAALGTTSNPTLRTATTRAQTTPTRTTAIPRAPATTAPALYKGPKIKPVKHITNPNKRDLLPPTPTRTPQPVPADIPTERTPENPTEQTAPTQPVVTPTVQETKKPTPSAAPEKYRKRAKSSGTQTQPIVGGVDNTTKSGGDSASPSGQFNNQTGGQTYSQPSAYKDSTSGTYRSPERMQPYAVKIDNRPVQGFGSGSSTYGGGTGESAKEGTSTTGHTKTPAPTIIATPHASSSTGTTGTVQPARIVTLPTPPTTTYHKTTIDRTPYKLSTPATHDTAQATPPDTTPEETGWFSSVIIKVKKFFSWITGS